MNAPTLPPRAAFVVGVARSGTTLLVRLLDAHPQCFVLPTETHAVDWCGAPSPADAFAARRRTDGKFFRDPERARLLEESLRRRVPGPVSLPDALRGLLEVYAAMEPPAAGARVWVEKTPKHLRSVPVLLRAFGPATRFVCMVRDPRAVMASQFEYWARGAIRHVRTFAARWAEADRLTARFAAEIPQFRVFRYEDLVARPEETMRGVAEHLGIDWDDVLLAPTSGGTEWRGNTSAREPLAGIETGSVDRYREGLGRDAVRELERLLAPRMTARGFELSHPAAAQPNARRSLTEFRAWLRTLRIERRWRRAAPEERPCAPAVRTSSS